MYTANTEYRLAVLSRGSHAVDFVRHVEVETAKKIAEFAEGMAKRSPLNSEYWSGVRHGYETLAANVRDMYEVPLPVAEEKKAAE
jgi:hypothetical protein